MSEAQRRTGGRAYVGGTLGPLQAGEQVRAELDDIAAEHGIRIAEAARLVRRAGLTALGRGVDPESSKENQS